MWLVLQHIVVRWQGGGFPDSVPTSREIGPGAFVTGVTDRWYGERWLYDYATALDAGPDMRTNTGTFVGNDPVRTLGLQFDLGLDHVAIRHLPNEQGQPPAKRELLRLRTGQWGGWIIDGRVGYFGAHYYARHFVNIALLKAPSPRVFLDRAAIVREDFRFLDVAR